MTVTEAESLARLGNVRAAVRVLFRAQELDISRRPTTFVDLLEAWAPGALPGCLANDRELREAILDVHRGARVDVSSAVLRLFGEPDAKVGVAVFPVVARDGRERRGALRAIEVAAAHEATKHPIVDESFVRAVEAARAVVLTRCGANVASRVREAKWRVLPDLASNVDLGDGSVGLAALVAFTSYALEKPVPATMAFSGLIEAARLESPNKTTAPEKLEALHESPSIDSLFWPAYEGSPHECISVERRIEPLLGLVFGSAWDELAVRLHPLSTGMAARRRLAGGVLVVGAGLVAAGALVVREQHLAPNGASAPLDAGSRVGETASASAPVSKLEILAREATSASAEPIPFAPSASGAAAAKPTPHLEQDAREAVNGAPAVLALDAARARLAARDGRGCLAELDRYDRETDALVRSTNPSSSAARDRALCTLLTGQCDEGRSMLRRIDDTHMIPGLTSEQRQAGIDSWVGSYCPSATSLAEQVQAAWGQLANGDATTCRKAYYKLKSLNAFVGSTSTTDPTKVPAIAAQGFVATCFERAKDCATGFKAYESMVAMWMSSEGARSTFDVLAPSCREK